MTVSLNEDFDAIGETVSMTEEEYLEHCVWTFWECVMGHYPKNRNCPPNDDIVYKAQSYEICGSLETLYLFWTLNNKENFVEI